ncbi:pilus assembly protein [Sphingobium sp. DEHP117]|uniref:TadE/TadG family type IV pilus assembly protein n=1 Tax=Sphingobium sp. DEHP117 TaxID=2993436 RepID=UPI0027D5538F|nr:pilus assembly protein [Sphingobium sp. DEHP117]MDQ4419856.1 pilus assembly protein [Sphingobium sp. DEHP117]
MRALDALRRLSRQMRRIGRDRSAIAVVEFAATLPFLMVTFISATELTNFTIVRMRVGQVALQVADNASRMGRVSLTGNPQVTETDINDLLTGADIQARNLNLYSRGRVIVSSLEPTANPNTAGTFKIRWQRCRGLKSSVSSWGVQGAVNLNGMGPTGQVVTTPDDTGVMFAEIFYDYQPLFASGLVPHTTIHEFASMIVRDSRDYNGPTSGTGANGGVYNAESATVHACDQFTTT